MRKTLKPLALLVGCLAITGCASERFILNNLYEDPVNFEYAINGESAAVTCDRAREGDPAMRAQQAATNFEQSLNAAVERVLQQYGGNETSAAAQDAIEREVDAIMLDNEQRFGCTVVPRV